MTQLQFDMICRIVQSGAPALANELCGALNDIVVDYNNLVEQIRSIQETDDESKDENPS